MANFLANLHNAVQSNIQSNNSLQALAQKLANFGSMIPTLVQSADQAQVSYQRLRKKVSKKLKKETKNHGLALENLGWGRLREFVESAFYGDNLNVTS